MAKRHTPQSQYSFTRCKECGQGFTTAKQLKKAKPQFCSEECEKKFQETPDTDSPHTKDDLEGVLNF